MALEDLFEVLTGLPEAEFDQLSAWLHLDPDRFTGQPSQRAVQMLAALEKLGETDEALFDRLREVAPRIGLQAPMPLPFESGVQVGLPGSLGKAFVGREDELDDLHYRMETGRDLALVAWEGVGRTRLAIEYAWRFGGFYTGGVFWIDGHNVGFRESQLHQILRQIDRQAPPLDIIMRQRMNLYQMVRDALVEMAGRGPILWIIDNVAADAAGGVAMEDWCPAPEATSVLATSALRLGDAPLERVPIGLLDSHASQRLLNFALRHTSVRYDEAERVVEWTGGLPLSLDLINRLLRARLLERPELKELCERKPSEDLEALRQSLVGRLPGRSIAAFVEIFALLSQRMSKSALALSRRIALLGPAEIPNSILNGLGEHAPRSARASLTGLGLLTGASFENVGSLHDTSRDLLRSQLDQAEAGRKTLYPVLSHLLSDEACQDDAERHALTPVVRHALSVLRDAEWVSVSGVKLSGRVVRFLLADGQIETAELMQRRLVERLELGQGATSPLTLAARSRLGDILCRRGRLDDAISLLEVVCDIREQQLGPQHALTLESSSKLAAALRDKGRLVEARALYELVAEAWKSQLGEDAAEVLTALNNEANTLAESGRFPEAIELHSTVLSKRVVSLGESHPQTQRSMRNLAAALASLGHFEQAARLYERALTGARRELGSGHPRSLAWGTEYANVVSAMGDRQRALQLYENLLEIRQQQFGPKHPETHSAMANLAAAQAAGGQLRAARRLQESLLSVRKRLLAADHPLLDATRNNLAMSLSALGMVQAAEKLFREVLASARERHGAEHPSSLEAASNLSSLLFNSGRIHAALLLDEEILTASIKQYRWSDSRSVRALQRFAMGLSSLASDPAITRLQKEAWFEKVCRRLIGDCEELCDALPESSRLRSPAEIVRAILSARCAEEFTALRELMARRRSNEFKQRLRGLLKPMLRGLGTFVFEVIYGLPTGERGQLGRDETRQQLELLRQSFERLLSKRPRSVKPYLDSMIFQELTDLLSLSDFGEAPGAVSSSSWRRFSPIDQVLDGLIAVFIQSPDEDLSDLIDPRNRAESLALKAQDARQALLGLRRSALLTAFTTQVYELTGDGLRELSRRLAIQTRNLFGLLTDGIGRIHEGGWPVPEREALERRLSQSLQILCDKTGSLHAELLEGGASEHLKSVQEAASKLFSRSEDYRSLIDREDDAEAVLAFLKSLVQVFADRPRPLAAEIEQSLKRWPRSLTRELDGRVATRLSLERNRVLREELRRILDLIHGPRLRVASSKERTEIEEERSRFEASFEETARIIADRQLERSQRLVAETLFWRLGSEAEGFEAIAELRTIEDPELRLQMAEDQLDAMTRRFAATLHELSLVELERGALGACVDGLQQFAELVTTTKPSEESLESALDEVSAGLLGANDLSALRSSARLVRASGLADHLARLLEFFREEVAELRHRGGVRGRVEDLQVALRRLTARDGEAFERSEEVLSLLQALELVSADIARLDSSPREAFEALIADMRRKPKIGEEPARVAVEVQLRAALEAMLDSGDTAAYEKAMAQLSPLSEPWRAVVTDFMNDVDQFLRFEDQRRRVLSLEAALRQQSAELSRMLRELDAAVEKLDSARPLRSIFDDVVADLDGRLRGLVLARRTVEAPRSLEQRFGELIQAFDAELQPILGAREGSRRDESKPGSAQRLMDLVRLLYRIVDELELARLNGLETSEGLGPEDQLARVEAPSLGEAFAS